MSCCYNCSNQLLFSVPEVLKGSITSTAILDNERCSKYQGKCFMYICNDAYVNLKGMGVGGILQATRYWWVLKLLGYGTSIPLEAH